MSPSVALVHYSAPPVVGGVESVLEAHAREFIRAGWEVTVAAGAGDERSLPRGTCLAHISELDSQHPEIQRVSSALEAGIVPDEFEILVERIIGPLGDALAGHDHVMIHNVLTKHFNLPLTAALNRLMDAGKLRGCIAWNHDFTWTSPRSGHLVHPGYPWDLLRTARPDVTYVTISAARQTELAALYGVPLEQIHIVYNGVDVQGLLGLSAETAGLAERLGLSEASPALLMPVRVTKAKNIELAIRLAAAMADLGAAPRIVLTGPPDPHSLTIQGYYEELLALRDQLDARSCFRFVYESGRDPDQPLVIDQGTVNQLYRLADGILLTSHAEGFGMPVLEAGLAGTPVISTGQVPAAAEIGGADVLQIDPQADPFGTARQILDWLGGQPAARLRARVRREFSWQTLFEQKILPLLEGDG